MKKFLITTTALLGMVSLGQAAEELDFVFELVRHGARAPIVNQELDKFDVYKGMLTPSGMRQRYLLGRYQRHRYTEEFKFLDPERLGEQVYIQSTDVNRTMQSGYSELLGLMPPGSEGAPQLSAAEVQRLEAGTALPPFKVRDAAQINSDLGFAALPNDFNAHPIYVYMNSDIHDDCSYDGCPYADATVDFRRHDNELYKPWRGKAEIIKPPVRTALDLTVEDVLEASFYDMYHYTDTIRCLKFEGVPMDWTFTDRTWLDAEEMQKIVLTNMFDDPARALVFSRMMRKPLLHMQRKVAEALGEEAGAAESGSHYDPRTKYMIYSAHDDQVDDMMWWLNEDDYEWDYVLFASQVVFELSHESPCAAADASCFGVRVFYNGNGLTLPGVPHRDFRMQYSDFTAYMQSIWYSGPGTLDSACYQPFVAPGAELFLQ